MKDLFNSADANGDGKLYKTELEKFFEAQDKTYYHDALEEMDQDGTKAINCKEFISGIIKWQTEQLMTVVEAIEEMYEMKRNGIQYTSAELDQIDAEADHHQREEEDQPDGPPPIAVPQIASNGVPLEPYLEEESQPSTADEGD